MSQGLCFFNADHKLIVCNDRFIEMYGLPPHRVGPGTPLTDIVDLRYEAGSFPAMSREEYVRWRTDVAVSSEAKDSIVELMDGRTIKIRHQPMPGGAGWRRMRTSPKQRRSEGKIAHMARHDALTDLAQPRAAERAAGRQALVAAHGRTVAFHHARPRPLQGRQRHARPSGRRQAAQAVADAPARPGARRPTSWRGMGGDEFADRAGGDRRPGRRCRSLAQRIIERDRASPTTSTATRSSSAPASASRSRRATATSPTTC